MDGSPSAVSEGASFGSGGGRWILAITVLGSGMAFLDGTVVNIALPDIGRDLDASNRLAAVGILNGYVRASPGPLFRYSRPSA